MQGIAQSMERTDAKLNRIADFGDRLKELKTKHEMTVKHNADAYVKLQVCKYQDSWSACEQHHISSVTAVNETIPADKSLSCP